MTRILSHLFVLVLFSFLLIFSEFVTLKFQKPIFKAYKNYNVVSCSKYQVRSNVLAESYTYKKPIVKPITFASARRIKGQALLANNTAPSETASAALNSDQILNLINAQRGARGLPALEKEGQLCNIAAARAPELAGEIATGRLHAGLRAKAGSLPFRLTENMKHGGTEEGAVNWWLHSPVHRRAMLGNYKYTCGTCSGKTCIQLFSNLAPK